MCVRADERDGPQAPASCHLGDDPRHRRRSRRQNERVAGGEAGRGVEEQAGGERVHEQLRRRSVRQLVRDGEGILGRHDDALLPRRRVAELDDALADGQAFHVGADGLDRTHPLVAADRGQVAKKPVGPGDGREVGRVDRAVREPNADLASVGLWNRDAVEPKNLGRRPVSVEAEGTHRILRSG